MHLKHLMLIHIGHRNLLEKGKEKPWPKIRKVCGLKRFFEEIQGLWM